MNYESKSRTMDLTVHESIFLTSLSLTDDDLTLRFIEKRPASAPDDAIPEYKFQMVHSVTAADIGHIHLRAGYTENVVLYRGNIGFAVAEAYRGRHYSARSCWLLMPIIRFLKINPVWITCNLGNIASQKNIESLHPEFGGGCFHSPQFAPFPVLSRRSSNKIALSMGN